MAFDRHRGGVSLPPPCHTTVRTGPHTAFRVGYSDSSSNNEGSPRDLRYALESPTDRAVAFARYQGPKARCRRCCLPPADAPRVPIALRGGVLSTAAT